MRLCLLFLSGCTLYAQITQIPGGGGGGTPASPNTAIQFNNSGVLGGSANLTWNGTGLGIGGSPVSATGFTLTDNDGSLTQMSTVRVASGNGNIQLWNQARNTVASPTASHDADAIIDWRFRGYAAGAYHIGGGIYGSVNGTPSAGTPGSMAMYVNGDNGAQKYSIVEDQTGIHLQSVTTDFVRVDTTGVVIPALTGSPALYSANGIVSATANTTWANGTLKTLFSGGGLNDFTSTSTTASNGHYWEIYIDATGTPDTFAWRVDNGSYTSGVAITGSSQALSNGFAIRFAATTGHTQFDQWSVYPAYGLTMGELSYIRIGTIPTGIPTFNSALGPVGELTLATSGASSGEFSGIAKIISGSGTGYDFLYYAYGGFDPTTPTASSDRDWILYSQYSGHDGTNFQKGAENVVWIDGNPTSGIVPVSQCYGAGAAGLSLRTSGNIGLLNISRPCSGSHLATEDLGIRRSAAGVLEVNTGTAGTLASVKANFTGATYNTVTNCASAASPAVCAAAPAGAVAIPTGVTSVALVVNTTAVTANSEITLTADDSLTVPATTCNSTLATLVGGLAVTARTPGTSFTITHSGTIAVNPLCVSYSIVN